MKTIVLGIGNPFMADDSVGIKVAESLEGVVDIKILTTTDFNIIDAVLGYDRAVIVDGVITGSEPGTIIEMTREQAAGKSRFSGTHNLSLAESLRIGYDLFGDEMPKDIRIIGVEVEDIESFGKGCTPKVEAAIAPAIERVKKHLL
ncbi:MAG TPA: hydrogenase maturation protease [Dissulfurispiraceae bacterium]|nr:hydrogenase maturation protease [Dissulfurispiraceae bacterium]